MDEIIFSIFRSHSGSQHSGERLALIRDSWNDGLYLSRNQISGGQATLAVQYSSRLMWQALPLDSFYIPSRWGQVPIRTGWPRGRPDVFIYDALWDEFEPTTLVVGSGQATEIIDYDYAPPWSQIRLWWRENTTNIVMNSLQQTQARARAQNVYTRHVVNSLYKEAPSSRDVELCSQ